MPLDAPVAGTDRAGTEFSRAILNDEATLDALAGHLEEHIDIDALLELAG